MGLVTVIVMVLICVVVFFGLLRSFNKYKARITWRAGMRPKGTPKRLSSVGELKK